jgi:hypothetical protein
MEPDYVRPRDHDRRMAAARARAQWELGSASWAGVILSAYEAPDEDMQALSDEQGEGVAHGT